jgi:hypothetical protein
MDIATLLILLIGQVCFLAAGHYSFMAFFAPGLRRDFAVKIWGTLAIAVPWSLYALIAGGSAALLVALLWLFVVVAGISTALFYLVDYFVVKERKDRVEKSAQPQ